MQNGPAARPTGAPNLANLIWTTADEVLRGDYKPHQYGSVILPFTVMRRLDCVLEPTKKAVLAALDKHHKSGIDVAYFFEKAAGGLKFWNTSRFDFNLLVADPDGVKKNAINYVGGFSESIRDIFEYYKVVELINDLASKNLLFLVVKKFASVNLHPDVVNNADMGQVFEELIRRFSESSNETAGEHYTPRDAIRLMVEVLFATDEDATLRKESRIVTLYDPTAGTGGMLSISEEHLKLFNDSIIVRPYGQELNPETYAICKADMLIKGQDISKIVLGNTLSNDAFSNERFDYMLSNPPYGVDWKKGKDEVETEHKRLGFKGRFGPGLPRISDGQMLFLLHLISKMHAKGKETSRIAIVMNGSPLFTGAAGSGESEIRRFVIENDLLEAIIGLPTEMFYNTGIATYVWILSNNKENRRKRKVQLIDATAIFKPMRRSLGNKRRYFDKDDIAEITRLYGDFKETETCKILANETFGYQTILVDRPLRLNFQLSPERLSRLEDEPSLTKNGIDIGELKETLGSIGPEKIFKSRSDFLNVFDSVLRTAGLTLNRPQYKTVWQCLSERDETAEVCIDGKGKPEADSELRDTENVPLGEDEETYFKRNVLPYMPDAWTDSEKTRIGYEIPFARYFYKYVPPRSLKAIDSDLDEVTSELVRALQNVRIEY